MIRNPWFTLALGLMLGLVFGYVLAERQPVPPARALQLGLAPAGAQAEALPEGHPPVAGQSGAAGQLLRQQVAEIEALLAANPDDPRLLAAMGNVYFDAERWQDSRVWYERSLAAAPDDVNVMTDLAIVHRNLGQPQPPATGRPCTTRSSSTTSTSTSTTPPKPPCAPFSRCGRAIPRSPTSRRSRERCWEADGVELGIRN